MAQIKLLVDEGVNLSDYQIRVVDDMEIFIEKVQIVTEGFDDRAIELLKYVTISEETEAVQFSYEHIVLQKLV